MIDIYLGSTHTMIVNSRHGLLPLEAQGLQSRMMRPQPKRQPSEPLLFLIRSHFHTPKPHPKAITSNLLAEQDATTGVKIESPPCCLQRCILYQ